MISCLELIFRYASKRGMILPALGKVRTILQDVLLPAHVTHLSTADPVTVSGSKTHEEHKNQTRNYAR